MAKPPPKPVRCAIYTRKSTEDGLEQAFNSLDAQYEACAAYITSQRHEGWREVRSRYDDGGFSGGTMERPALKRLLDDVKSGKVDSIVLYKVDRLTRSLSDFARIVEILDAAGASFVSVTQPINTTTSMGRLMLNVLLSFAQFEREMTGERIRDKIAASKRKGMWMGGNPPLGYDVQDRKLVVNEAEAGTVRHIFTRYVALGSGRALLEELRADGYRSKRRSHPGKPDTGGVVIQRGALFALLGNHTYRGKVHHKGKWFDGEHVAIIDEPLWEAVQQQVAAGRVARKTGSNLRAPSLLAGVIRDGLGRRMSPSHAVKGKRRYRYYCTHAAELTEAGEPAWRMPAKDLEDAVTDRIGAMLRDRRLVAGLAGQGAEPIRAALAKAEAAAEKLATHHGRVTLVSQLLSGVTVGEHRLDLSIGRKAFARLVGAPEDDDRPLRITAPASRFRRGLDVKLVLTSESGSASSPDPKLIALLRESAAARAIMLKPSRSLRQAADELKQCRHRIARLVQLSYLAPDIVTSILNGRQPAGLTVRRLMSTELPLSWRKQQVALGFA